MMDYTLHFVHNWDVYYRAIERDYVGGQVLLSRTLKKGQIMRYKIFAEMSKIDEKLVWSSNFIFEYYKILFPEYKKGCCWSSLWFRSLVGSVG